MSIGISMSMGLGFASPALGSVSLPEFPKLNELKKITVGPDDQLDGSVDPDGRLIVFTHQANLVSQIQVQDLRTGKVADLLPKDADSVQARFGPQNKILFVYYKKTAKGDICFTDEVKSLAELPLKESGVHCLVREDTNARTERSQPFWLDSNTVAFLEKSASSVQLKTASLNLPKESQLLAEGTDIFSPSGSGDGRYLVFSQRQKNTVRRLLTDRTNGKRWLVPVALPGSSGFTSLSDDGQFLYFSHFMGDSNQDTVINGHDNSVVWRVATKNIIAGPAWLGSEKEPNPSGTALELPMEQLTPMDMNCSFPVANKNSLFVTCAFEGSLDLYALSGEGFVPKAWGESVIEDAIRTGRSYQDRILLLNTLKARGYKGIQKASLQERIFNVHLLANELSAALFYAQSLEKVESLKIYLKARLYKKSQPLKAKMFLFKEAIHGFESELAKVKGEEALKKWVGSNLTAMLGQKLDLEALAQTLDKESRATNTPIQYWLYFNLAEELYLKDKEHLNQWKIVFQRLAQGPSVSAESRLYYAFEFLRYTENFSFDLRRKALTDFADRLKGDSEARALVQVEIYSLDLVNAKDKNEKLSALQKIDQLMRQHKANYFLRKAMNVRTVLNFLNHQEFEQLRLVATNWLRDTPAASTEFSYARDVVISAAREQAYGYWSQNNSRVASDYFFQSLSLTDDLESHAGYVNTMLQLGQRKNAEERLGYLQNHGAIGDGVPFVRALLSLEDHADEKALDSALSDLEAIRADVVDPMRNLLIGYVLMEKFKASKKGVDYDRELWQKAHQSLILAADLARGRSRVRAAALSNLGLLHLWGLNYNQSVRFWELRKQIGFDDPQMREDRKAFTWFYSQALFLANQPKRAAEEIASLPQDLQTEEFTERRAFDLAMGESFPEALKAYQKLAQTRGAELETLPEPSRTKVRLGYALTLMKLGQESAAKSLCLKILKEGLQSFKAEEGQRLMDFDSRETEKFVWGFLAQLGSEAERIKALQNRLPLLNEDLPASIQARQQLSELVSMSDPKTGADLMRKSLQETLVFTEDNGPIGQLVFRSLTNSMVHVLLFEEQYRGEDHKGLAGQVEKTLASLGQQAEFSPLPIQKEQWRLQYLWSLFQERIFKKAGMAQWREELLNSALSERLKKEDAAGFEQLQKSLRLL